MTTQGKKIVIFGSTGQIGSALSPLLSSIGPLVIPDRSKDGNLTQIPDIIGGLNISRPDIIVNAAAYTNVDGAEDNRQMAQTVNATAPAVMANWAAEHNALLVHYSTDYVYDGSGDAPWREDDRPAPLNVYGQSKLEGDTAIIASGCHHLIFRTSWIYSASPHNFVQKILLKAQRGEPLKIVDDQIGAPTDADFVARTTVDALTQTLQNKNLCGLYHVARAGETSWYDFAKVILAVNDLGHIAIQPVASTTFPSKTKRPLNSRLSLEKLQSRFSITPPDWSEGFLKP